MIIKYTPLELIRKITDYVVLNFLFLLCCLPIITIGSALTALYSVTLKDAKGHEPAIVRRFFSAFAQNLLKPTLLFVVHSFLLSIFLFNLFFWYSLNMIVGVVMIFCIALLLISFIYTYPLLAYFENTLTGTLKNSLLIGLTHKKQTLLLLLTFCGLFGLIISTPAAVLFFIVIGFAFFSYCGSFIFNTIFIKYESSQTHEI